MDSIREELTDSLAKKRWWALVGKYLLFGILLVGLAVYVGLLLFGTNSVEVLYNLNIQEKSLQRKIEFLKKENARLQKKYFELKELEPQQ